jgi:hypothetical protein
VSPGFNEEKGSDKLIDKIEIEADCLKDMSKTLFYGSVIISSAALVSETGDLKMWWPVAVNFAVAYVTAGFSDVWEMKGGWKRFMTVFSVVALLLGVLGMTAVVYIS